MTLIKKLYKLKRSVYYLGKYIIFRNKREIDTIGHCINDNQSTYSFFITIEKWCVIKKMKTLGE